MNDAAHPDAIQANDSATLHYPGGVAEFPIVHGTDGASAIDVSTLTRDTGLTALDHGFVNTASTTSAITYIDGDAGILRYRGYAIEDIAANSTYLEVAWLLIHGELPTAVEFARFEEDVRRHTLLHEDLRRFFDALPHSAHPMSVLSSAVGALGTFYEDSLDVRDPGQVENSTIRLLAKLPVIAAYAHKKSLGQAFLYPDNNLSFVDNFLKLNFGNMAEEYEVNPVLSKSRAECLNIDGQAGRLHAGQHLLLHFRWNQCALRSAARWCERSCADDARPDPRIRRRCETFCGEGQEQGRGCQADGLRAPRLQEL